MSKSELTDSDIDPIPEESSDENSTVQLEMLSAENRRLRQRIAQSRQVGYRRTALGLLIVGGIAAAGGVVFPGTRSVLFALAGTGLFGAFLVYYLTPERFISATVGERIFEAYARNGRKLIGNLGLQESMVYVPTTEQQGETIVRLFVPRHTDFVLPQSGDLQKLFVVTEGEEGRGISLHPTGLGLFQEFQSTSRSGMTNDAETLGQELADVLVDTFELADGATVDIAPGQPRLSVRVKNSTHGPVDQFDHPVASFIATGMAAGLETPISLDVSPAGDGRSEYLVTCRWSDDDNDLNMETAEVD